jgi:hypothetical protein
MCFVHTDQPCMFFAVITHGPLKLRTVHLSDNTIIYESKVSVKNIFL